MSIPDQHHQNRSADVLLEVKHLRVWFATDTNWLGTPKRFVRAVEDVSFSLCRSEVVAIVGSEGAGKSTLARAIIGLQYVESGGVFYEGTDVLHLGPRGWRATRRKVQLLFSDPLASLDPRMTVSEALREPLAAHAIVPRKEAPAEVRRLLDLAGLPGYTLGRYPHELSPGQQVRACIARALSLRPQLIVCDDILRTLDAGEQAHTIALLKDLHTALGLSCLFLSQDADAARAIASSVLMMQNGKIVERVRVV